MMPSRKRAIKARQVFALYLELRPLLTCRFLAVCLLHVKELPRWKSLMIGSHSAVLW